MIRSLFSFVPPDLVAAFLAKHHYLGPTTRGFAWRDEIGVAVFASPTSRRLPANWLDLTRWCIVSDTANAGSMQWGRIRRALVEQFPDVTTIVSYSDPSKGHTGALYRACNWWWAPTWHRLRPPPSGNGSWNGVESESVKDRWVFPLRRDPSRESLLVAADEATLRRFPMARYREPGGADWKAWRAAVA